MVNADAALAIAGNLVEEIAQTGAEAVITACQQCKRTLRRALEIRESPIQVLDIGEVVLRAMTASP